jgi:hypothetical protein
MIAPEVDSALEVVGSDETAIACLAAQ